MQANKGNRVLQKHTKYIYIYIYIQCTIYTHVKTYTSNFQDIYNNLVRPRFDYRYIIYNQLNNESFCNRTQKVRYNTALAITSVIRETT